MGIGGRLRDQDAVGVAGGLQEVVRSHVCHDLRARENLDIEFLLELVESLWNCDISIMPCSVLCCIAVEMNVFCGGVGMAVHEGSPSHRSSSP